jgi:hypothetical protein
VVRANSPPNSSIDGWRITKEISGVRLRSPDRLRDSEQKAEPVLGLRIPRRANQPDETDLPGRLAFDSPDTVHDCLEAVAGVAVRRSVGDFRERPDHLVVEGRRQERRDFREFGQRSTAVLGFALSKGAYSHTGL